MQAAATRSPGGSDAVDDAAELVFVWHSPQTDAKAKKLGGVKFSGAVNKPPSTTVSYTIRVYADPEECDDLYSSGSESDTSGSDATDESSSAGARSPASALAEGVPAGASASNASTSTSTSLVPEANLLSFDTF